MRVDKRRSYLLYGDFTTNANIEARKLSNYSRSLTGVKEHFENERISVNAFASRDSTRQVVDEIRAEVERDCGFTLDVSYGSMLEVVRACLRADALAEDEAPQPPDAHIDLKG